MVSRPLPASHEAASWSPPWLDVTSWRPPQAVTTANTVIAASSSAAPRLLARLAMVKFLSWYGFRSGAQHEMHGGRGRQQAGTGDHRRRFQVQQREGAGRAQRAFGPAG